MIAALKRALWRLWAWLVASPLTECSKCGGSLSQHEDGGSGAWCEHCRRFEE